MTYTLPDDIRQVAEEGEFNEFDLNEFFRPTGKATKQRLSTRTKFRSGSI